MAFTQSDYSKIISEKPRKEFKETAFYLNSIEKIAMGIIKELSVFSFESFAERLYSGYGNKQDLFTALKSRANNLRNESRIATALSYECALNSIKTYVQKNLLPFDIVDITFLNKYEKWMKEQGNSDATVGIYLRNVRTVYNDAIRNGKIKAETFPFGRRKYQIPVGRNIKKALSQKEISLVTSYPVIEGTNEQRFRDYWLFCYLANGINVKDMAHLKYSNIDGEVINFIRAKTQRELRQKPRNITIVITKMIGRIIDKWGNKPRLPVEYLFPILRTGLTPQQEYAKIHQTIKLMNKYINKIAKTVGITANVTTYTARHSFATILKRSGASMEFISESLGHSNLHTTENYLADFEIAEKKKWAEKVEEAANLN